MLSRLKSKVRSLVVSGGFSETSRRTAMVRLEPSAPARGRVLLSYILDPFLTKAGEISNDHTHYWESHCMARCFLKRGFAVDVIHFENYNFRAEEKYDVFVGARTNFERIAQQLDSTSLKIAHLDTAHWLYNNTYADRRLVNLLERRGVALTNAKTVAPNWALESADMGSVLGNEFTMQTYQYAGKPIHRIPISVPQQYDWPQERDFSSAKRNFIWFGSSGFVHKGLDLVLEAFVNMPDYQLYVCGPLEDEKRFCAAYERELRHTDNIIAVGWVDVTSKQFFDLAHTCSALVYPSCSEGGGGSVLTCMHAGLMPIVTPQSSVDIGDSGLLIENATVEEIMTLVRQAAEMSVVEIESRCRLARETARSNHTRAIFQDHFNNFIDEHVLPAHKQKAGI